MEGIPAFQISTTRIYNSNSSPPSPSFWKEASLLLTVFLMCTVWILTNAGAAGILSTWKAQWCSGGCIPNRWRHHGHKPESCQPLGRRGFCMTIQGNLGEWSMSRPKLWVHQSLLCDGGQITITYHCSVQDALHDKFAWPLLYFWEYHWD